MVINAPTPPTRLVGEVGALITINLQTSQLSRFDRQTHGFGPVLTVKLNLSLVISRLTHSTVFYLTARLNQAL